MADEPKHGTPEWYRKHPIFGTDFSKPAYDLVEDVRDQLSRARGQLGDIAHGYPGWKEQLEEVEGLITCGIAFLYGIREEMNKAMCPRPGPVVDMVTISSVQVMSAIRRGIETFRRNTGVRISVDDVMTDVTHELRNVGKK